MKKYFIKNPGRRAAAGTAALLAAAGILVSGLFRSPADLMDSPAGVYIPAITESLPDPSASDPDGGDAPVSDEKRRGIASRLRLWLLSLPAPLRALAGVPLWILGWGLSLLLSSLWSGLLSPALSGALHYVLLALLMLAVLAAAVKAVHPSLPLRGIFSRRTVSALAAGMLAVGACDVLLHLLLPDEPWLSRLLGLAATLAVFFIAALPLLLRRPGSPPSSSSLSLAEEDTRALVESLAARVSR